jgi:hypothetical protein
LLKYLSSGAIPACQNISHLKTLNSEKLTITTTVKLPKIYIYEKLVMDALAKKREKVGKKH